MLLHVDGKKFKIKPTEKEIGALKVRFTNAGSVKDLSVKQIAACLTAGRTIQPGVCPYSEETRKKGKKGTCKDDFTRQTVFLDDVDNKLTDIPLETPAHVKEVLAAHNLQAAFMYETFNSTADNQRFRFALVSDEEFTDKAERDRVQAAIIALFPQSDLTCTNADRMFFGTDKGLLDDYTDFEAVCRKADLLALADAMQIPENPEQTAKAEQTVQAQKEKPDYSGMIPDGRRNSTLASVALSLLKKYGEDDGRAFEAFMQTAAKCSPPLDDRELQTIWNSAVKGYRGKVLTDPAYLTPKEYLLREFTENLEPTDYTDVGQANLFAAVYGDVVKYTPATKFLIYDGSAWRESETKAQGLSQELTERQLVKARDRVKRAQAELIEAQESGDSDAMKEAKGKLNREESFHAFVLARRKTDKVKATLTETRPKVEIDVSQLDADGSLLNTPAGTVDLRTGEIKPHAPEDYCTKITAVSPDTENAAMFADFMERVTVGDKELERYLQEIAGMCAVGHVYRENLIIAYGEGGNGKSTLFNLLSRVLGDYAGALSAETLTANCRKNKSPEYAELRGKRIIIAAELEEGMRLDTAVVKKLCSTDPILAEKKYKDPFTFIPSHTVILYTNYLPKIGTTDKGTWDRIVAVPFLANFRGMKGEIKNYGDHLFQHCGGAVLSWIIEGARRFIANGFDIALPECVKQAIDQYRANNDWLEHFLAECCDIDRRYSEKSGELYARYRSYCDSTGDYRRSLADFKQALTAAGFDTRKTKAGAFVYGLRVVSDFLECDEPTPWDELPA